MADSHSRNMADIEPDSPDAKRRCFFSSDSDAAVDNVLICASLYFPDGDIILETGTGVGKVHFKIHSECLKHSDVFAGMLDLPQPAEAESIDGCPVVRLADASEDWAVALRWMCNPEEFVALPQPVHFSLIPGSLRIAEKYEIAELREWCVCQLRARWPTELERMDSNSFSFAAEAISLAREFGVPEILPAAFYALAITRWSTLADGGRAHLLLSRTDMRRLLYGRERLAIPYADLLRDPLYAHGTRPACHACAVALASYWYDHLLVRINAPYDCWLLNVLFRMIKEKDVELAQSVCPPCYSWHVQVAHDRFVRLKNLLKTCFN